MTPTTDIEELRVELERKKSRTVGALDLEITQLAEIRRDVLNLDEVHPGCPSLARRVSEIIEELGKVIADIDQLQWQRRHILDVEDRTHRQVPS